MTKYPTVETLTCNEKTTMREGNRLFPFFFKLENFPLLIVGGGAVGLEKLNAVLVNSPKTVVTLVGQEISTEIRTLAADFEQVILREKVFERSDLEGQRLVIAATNNPVLNRQVKALASGRGIFTNVADTPDLCDFYLGSIVQKGDVKIAISTNGKSPTIAKRLRETFDDALPNELDDLLQNMPVLRSRLKGDFTQKVRTLNALTASLAVKPEDEDILPALLGRQKIESINGRKWRNIATAALTAFGLMMVVNILLVSAPLDTWVERFAGIDNQFWMFIGVGFVAQLIDGLLGMGYGVVTQIFLMGAGVPLASVSSSIHTAEMFTSGVSGYSHYRFGNVNRRLFRALLVPGIVGAVAGAALLSWLGEQYVHIVKPLLAIYALLLGVRILRRAFQRNKQKKKVKNVGWLAGAGGFLDSFGGGGWGPLVTSTLLSKGKTPQYVIGSVSLVEFFITLCSALTFFTLIGISHWQIIAGLIIGGTVAAPFAARLAGKLPLRTMFIAVGVMVIFWSLRILWKQFF